MSVRSPIRGGGGATSAARRAPALATDNRRTTKDVGRSVRCANGRADSVAPYACQSVVLRRPSGVSVDDRRKAKGMPMMHRCFHLWLTREFVLLTPGGLCRTFGWQTYGATLWLRCPVLCAPHPAPCIRRRLSVARAGARRSVLVPPPAMGDRNGEAAFV